MGNDLALPTNDEINSGQMIGRWTAGYKQSQAGQDKIKMSGGEISIGAKILQQVTGPKRNELYVINDQGREIYLTNEGKPFPDAAKRVAMARNYERGPAVEFLGDPLHPDVRMFSGDDETAGDHHGWKMQEIRNEADLQFAVKHKLRDTGQIEASRYGFAAVNPFLEKPRDIWSGVADFNRGFDKVAPAILIPVAEGFLDDVVPGASNLLDATGATSAMIQGLEDFTKGQYGHGQEHEAGSSMAASFSDVLTDPRVEDMYEQVMRNSKKWDRKSNDRSLQTAMNLPDFSNEQKIAKVKALNSGNLRLFVDEQSKELLKSSSLLKAHLGNRTDFNFDNLAAGLQAAQDDTERLRVLQFMSGEIKSFYHC